MLQDYGCEQPDWSLFYVFVSGKDTIRIGKLFAALSDAQFCSESVSQLSGLQCLLLLSLIYLFRLGPHF